VSLIKKCWSVFVFPRDYTWGKPDHENFLAVNNDLYVDFETFSKLSEEQKFNLYANCFRAVVDEIDTVKTLIRERLS
jgi:hypothetical protein